MRFLVVKVCLDAYFGSKVCFLNKKMCLSVFFGAIKNFEVR